MTLAAVNQALHASMLGWLYHPLLLISKWQVLSRPGFETVHISLMFPLCCLRAGEGDAEFVVVDITFIHAHQVRTKAQTVRTQLCISP